MSDGGDRRAAINSTLLGVGKTLATVVEAIIPIVAVRILDKPGANALFELILVLTVLASVFSAGLPNTLSFYLPGRTPSERRAIAAIVFRAGLLLGIAVAALLLVGGLVVAAGAGGTKFDNFAHLSWAALFPAGEIALKLLPNLLVVEERAKLSATIPLIRSVLFSLALLGPLVAGAGLEEVAISLGAIGLAMVLFTGWTLHRVYRAVPTGAVDVSVRRVLKFGLPLGLTEVTNSLNSSLDRALIWLLVGSTLLADYAVGAWQFPAIPALAYAIGVSYTPVFAARFKAGRASEAIAMWKQQIAKTSLLVVPLAMMLIVSAEEVVQLLFTSEYDRAADVFRCYSLVTLGRVTAFGNLLIAANRPDLVARASALSLVSNVALSIPLALTVGFMGPAIGTVGAFVCMVCVYLYYIAHVSEVPMRSVYPYRAFFSVFAIATVAGGIAWGLKVWVEAPPALGLLMVIAVVAVVFVPLALATGLAHKDDLKLGFLRGPAKKPGAATGSLPGSAD